MAAWPLAALANLPIYKIADFDTPASDGGIFTSFGLPVMGYQSQYYFQASTSGGVSGIYESVFNVSEQLLSETTVVDTSMSSLTGGTFASFSNLTGRFDLQGFVGTDSNGIEGVYLYDTGYIPSLMLVAKSNGTSATGAIFGDFHSLSASGAGWTPSAVADVVSDAGVFEVADSINQTSQLIADTSTVPPGASDPFSSFGGISFKNNDTFGDTEAGRASIIRAIRATAGNVEGIYWGVTDPGGRLTTSAPLVSLVSSGAATPDGDGTFTSFGDPIATDNDVKFTAHFTTNGLDSQGIFAYGPYADYGFIPDPPEIYQIVATGEIAPDSGGATFTGFGDISHDTFIATLNNGEKGLFTLSDLKVVETGDPIGSKIVGDIDLAPDSLNAFRVTFTDGSQGVYYFVAPEPAALGVAALPLILMYRRRRGMI